MTVRIKLPPVTMPLPLNSRDGQFVDYLGLAGIDEGVGYVRGPTPCVMLRCMAAWERALASIPVTLRWRHPSISLLSLNYHHDYYHL